MNSIWKKFALGALLPVFVLVAAGCGGDDDVAVSPKTTLSGQAVKGPIKNADVDVYAVKNDGSADTAGSIGHTTTDASGNYTVEVAATAGPVIVKVSMTTATNYFDEVTGTDKAFDAPASFRAVVPDVALKPTVALTPLTEVATQQIQALLLATPATTTAAVQKAIMAGNAYTGMCFGVSDILKLPGAFNDGAAMADQQTYSTALGIVAQLATDEGSIAQALTVLNSIADQDANAAASRTKHGAALTNLSTKLTNIPTAITGALSNAVANAPPKPDLADTTAPTVPAALIALSASGNAVTLSWAASTDANGVVGYEIFRDGVRIGQSPSPSYTDATASAGTTYAYAVTAYDAAANISAASESLSVSVTAGQNLTISVSGNVKL